MYTMSQKFSSYLPTSYALCYQCCCYGSLPGVFFSFSSQGWKFYHFQLMAAIWGKKLDGRMKPICSIPVWGMLKLISVGTPPPCLCTYFTFPSQWYYNVMWELMVVSAPELPGTFLQNMLPMKEDQVPWSSCLLDSISCLQGIPYNLWRLVVLVCNVWGL